MCKRASGELAGILLVARDRSQSFHLRPYPLHRAEHISLLSSRSVTL